MTDRHFNGPFVSTFSTDFSVGNSQIRDVIMSSLSPSVWQGQPLVGASERRAPAGVKQQQETMGVNARIEAFEDVRAVRAIVWAETPATCVGSEPQERGSSRGRKPEKASAHKHCEDVLGFEGRFGGFFGTHATT